MVMLDTISWSRDHDGGVAHAQPSLIVSSAVFDGGKGTCRPGRCPGLFAAVVVAGGSRSWHGDRMTANKNLKRQVRARAAKTGESYTTALRHFRSTAGGDGKVSAAKAMRLAVARTTLREDPRRIDELRAKPRTRCVG